MNIKALVKRALANDYVHSASGTVASQVVNSLGFLLLASITTPTVIGEFAAIMALAFLISMFFTFRFEILGFYAKNSGTENLYFHAAARYMFLCSCGFALLACALITTILTFFPEHILEVSANAGNGVYVFTVGFCLSIQSLIFTHLNKKGKFLGIAQTRLIVAVFTVSAQLVLCYRDPTVGKLVAGVLVGHVFGKGSKSE